MLFKTFPLKAEVIKIQRVVPCKLPNPLYKRKFTVRITSDRIVQVASPKSNFDSVLDLLNLK